MRTCSPLRRRRPSLYHVTCGGGVPFTLQRKRKPSPTRVVAFEIEETKVGGSRSPSKSKTTTTTSDSVRRTPSTSCNYTRSFLPVTRSLKTRLVRPFSLTAMQRYCPSSRFVTRCRAHVNRRPSLLCVTSQRSSSVNSEMSRVSLYQNTSENVSRTLLLDFIHNSRGLEDKSSNRN